MQMDMYNSPLTKPHGWGFTVPDDAIEFVAGVNKGLERRYGLILKGQNGNYDIVKVYKNKKGPNPMVELSRNDYIKYNIVDSYQHDDGEKYGAGFWALMDLEEDGSFAIISDGEYLEISSNNLSKLFSSFISAE